MGLFAQVQVCLFKKFEDEDRARLSWIGVDLRAGGGRGPGGRTRSGSSKSSPHHLGRWQGSMLRTSHSWCAKGRGLEGELLSGMQGPSPQGGAAEGTRAHPGQKALGRSQSVGGLSGQVPVQGKSPSTSELHGRRGPWRDDQGSDCEERQRSSIPKKEERTAQEKGCSSLQPTQQTGQSRRNPRSFARSCCCLWF